MNLGELVSGIESTGISIQGKQSFLSDPYTERSWQDYLVTLSQQGLALGVRFVLNEKIDYHQYMKEMLSMGFSETQAKCILVNTQMENPDKLTAQFVMNEVKKLKH